MVEAPAKFQTLCQHPSRWMGGILFTGRDSRPAPCMHAGISLAAVITAGRAGKAGVRDVTRINKAVEALSGRWKQLSAANPLRKSERKGLKTLNQCELSKEMLHHRVIQDFMAINVCLSAINQEVAISIPTMGRIITREHIKTVGGSIANESKPGRATKMTMRIPVSKTTE